MVVVGWVDVGMVRRVDEYVEVGWSRVGIYVAWWIGCDI